MNVVIIGSGNVATVFGRIIKDAGHKITEVYSRDAVHASLLATELQAISITDLEKISKEADIYIIAVSDDSIQRVADALELNKKIVVHTSGSVSKNVLQNVSINYGVLYPLQSLRKEIKHKQIIPLLIDGSNDEITSIIRSLAETISEKVTNADDNARLKLHVAAVIASNFSNHLYTLTEAFCDEEDVSFSMLIPLIQEVALRLNELSPKLTQTGPAIRGDDTTIKKHLEILSVYPQLQKIYADLSESIRKFYSK